MARKAPRAKLGRRGPQRKPYDRVLVACVGERTEPLYFRELAKAHGLSTANVVVVPSHLDPMGVVKLAKEKRREERSKGDDYDRVYCVFDRDDQKHFESASQAAEKAGFHLARSWPCFEFWFLLHFEHTRQPFQRSGGKASATIASRL